MRLKPPNSEIVVGRFGSPHGVRGALKLFVYGQSPKQVAKYKPWLTQNKQGQWQPIDVKRCEAKPEFLLVTLEGIDDRDSARSFTNKEIAVYASVLPKLPAGEYYCEELVELDVVNHNGVNFGKVNEVFATGANDVLVVRDNSGNERLIPFVLGEYVKEIDEEKRLITVEWDEDF